MPAFCTSVLAKPQQSFKSCYLADKTSLFKTMVLTMLSVHWTLWTFYFPGPDIKWHPYVCDSPQPWGCLPGQYNTILRGTGTPYPWVEYHYMDISPWLPGTIQVIRDTSTAWPGASGFQDAQNILLQIYQSKAPTFPPSVKMTQQLNVTRAFTALFCSVHLQQDNIP